MIPKKLHFIIYILLVISLQSCKKATQFIPEKSDNLVEINRLIALGDHFFESSKYDSSYYYFDKAKLACDPKKLPKLFVYAISNLATIQQNQGDFSGSEITAMEAMPILETTIDPNYKWSIYTILGINYLNTFDYENAHYYYNKAFNLKTNESRKIGAKNNIAIVYMDQGDYNLASEILFALAKEKKKIKRIEDYARILDNLGNCYDKLENPKALAYLNESLKLRLKAKDDWGLIASYFNMYIYFKERNSTLAREYAQLTYQKATKVNSVDDRLMSLKSLIQVSTGTQLKKYFIKYVTISDSITKVRQKAKNQFAKMKYDSKKASDEILQLKSQKEQNILELGLEKNTTLNLYFLVGILLIITVLVYHYLVEKGKREKSQTTYDTEVRIAKKLHDELANDVYQAIAFTETQDLSSTYLKEILLEHLDTIYSRTRNISKENSTVPMGPNFIPNLKEMISEFNTNTVMIMIYGIEMIDWQIMTDTKKITVYRVIQELLINMKKHSESTLVVLSFKKDQKIVQLNYTDNGVGATFKKQKIRNGLQNVENRIHAIKGTITFDTETGKGFKVNILFPI
jgi:signal transduction histidine kinase